MSYQANIPAATDKISKSQADIQANFTAIQNLIGVNHGNFGSAVEGKHLVVTMPAQSVDPSTGAAELAMYTKTITGVTQLLLRQPSNGSIVNLTGATANATNATTTLPSGIILKWGVATSIPAGTSTVTFTNPFPNNIFACYATISVIGGSSPSSESMDRLVRIYDYDKTFLKAVTYIDNVARARAAQTFAWFAIGN